MMNLLESFIPWVPYKIENPLQLFEEMEKEGNIREDVIEMDGEIKRKFAGL